MFWAYTALGKTAECAGLPDRMMRRPSEARRVGVHSPTCALSFPLSFPSFLTFTCFLIIKVMPVFSNKLKKSI